MQYMMNQWKKIGFIIGILIIAVLFTGCRPSPVLEQIIYTQNAVDVDPEEQKLIPETQAAESEQLDPQTQEDADNKKDTKNQAGKSDENADAKNDAKNINYDKKADGKASANNKDGSGSGNNGVGKKTDETKETEESQTKETKKQKTKETEESEEETTMQELAGLDETEEESQKQQDEEGETVDSDSGDSKEGDAQEETTEAPKKVVSDGKGEEQEIPEDVHTVTAVGSVASIVEMLGGSGRLIGSSDNFISSSLANILCEDVADGSIQTWWFGDGTEAISDSHFKKLLEAAPEVCFEISGQNTFSSSQIKQLEEAGISYMVLPALDSVQNLKDAVTIVANVLDSNVTTGKSAAKIAKSYCDWVDETLNTVESKTSNVALASLYISEWRDDITYQFEKNYESLPAEACSNGKGSGVAIAWSPKKDEMMTTWMAAAGVTNTSTSNGNLDDTEGSYVTPMFHQFFPKFSSSQYCYYDTNIAAGADWFVTQKITDSSFNLLGSEAFPAIIVADNEIKNAIENNWYWQYWGELTGSDWGFGYTSADGTTFYSSIGGDYQIYVSPTGIESWADGCVESPLEAYWIADKISGKISDSTLKSKVKAFYKDFFGVSLSDSDLNQIIG